MCCGLEESIRMSYCGYDAPYQFYGSYPPVCLYVISFNYVTLLCFIAIGNIRVTIECKFSCGQTNLSSSTDCATRVTSLLVYFLNSEHTLHLSRAPLSKAWASILPVLSKHLSGNPLPTRAGAINSNARRSESV